MSLKDIITRGQFDRLEYKNDFYAFLDDSGCSLCKIYRTNIEKSKYAQKIVYVSLGDHDKAWLDTNNIKLPISYEYKDGSLINTFNGTLWEENLEEIFEGE